ncbi:uncharacterized protein LOC142573136 isoform X4 [Dermacentor variabilis]|uniref:uncharacterized protein LOC142573136 isoform X4 n=1 Tax=Dermacentor variabilis TaxID=34621 RepID=UPI003F5B4634
MESCCPSPPPEQPEKARQQSWVTLATDDTYAFGALVLGYSLREARTRYKLTVLVTRDVGAVMRHLLAQAFDDIEQVTLLRGRDPLGCPTREADGVACSYTKLHVWRLQHLSKGVFLDADTLVLANCDELFQRRELSAVPLRGWPDLFDTGVFVFVPSEKTHGLVEGVFAPACLLMHNCSPCTGLTTGDEGGQRDGQLRRRRPWRPQRSVWPTLEEGFGAAAALHLQPAGLGGASVLRPRVPEVRRVWHQDRALLGRRQAVDSGLRLVQGTGAPFPGLPAPPATPPDVVGPVQPPRAAQTGATPMRRRRPQAGTRLPRRDLHAALPGGATYRAAHRHHGLVSVGRSTGQRGPLRRVGARGGGLPGR